MRRETAEDGEKEDNDERQYWELETIFYLFL